MIALLLSVALADVPPPRGYVETCTVAKQCAETEEGLSCAGYHGGREPCEALEASGYTKKCQTRGASVWTEVMCRPKTENGPLGAPASAGDAEATEPAEAEEPAEPTDAGTAAEPAPTVIADPADDKRCGHTPGAPVGWGALAALLLSSWRRKKS